LEGELEINASEGGGSEGRRLKEKGTDAERRREAVKRRARNSQWREKIEGAVLVDMNNFGCLVRRLARLLNITSQHFPSIVRPYKKLQHDA
jgi:hypothetical protein